MRYCRLLVFLALGVEPFFGPFSVPDVGWRTGNFALKLTGRSLQTTPAVHGEIKRRKDKRKEKKVKGEKKKKDKKEKPKKVKGEKKKKEKKVRYFRTQTQLRLEFLTGCNTQSLLQGMYLKVVLCTKVVRLFLRNKFGIRYQSCPMLPV